MKPVFSKEQIKLVEEAVEKVNALSEQQIRIYEDLLERLDIKSDSNEEPWIFDSVYNNIPLEESSV
jgi:hypothetical protein